MKPKTSIISIVMFIVLSALSFIVFFPLLWMVLSSFKGAEEIWRSPPTFIPETWSISGYQELFRRMSFGRYFFNSIFVAAVSTVISLFTSSLAGYIFAKIRFRGRHVIFLLVLSSMMIPGQITMIPNYMLILALNLYDTYLALILPQGITVFGIFLIRQYLLSFPDEYIEAARIDGLGEFKIYSSIVVPLNLPAIAALAIFSFRGAWDNLLWPLIMTSSESMRTLPVAIASLTTVHSPLMELILPASTISIVPILIVFFIFQKQFVQGITMSGLKA
ncbi:carbohydrate ABC transporter permease [Treponema sp. OttesenSCG-928-L16]|nr:carbohydrate ABC transporter permease [Treponema sp. OttesenSCG-928-L16]